MKKLLIAGHIKYSKEQWAQLKTLDYEIIIVEDERLPLQMDVSDIEVVVCNSLFVYNSITKFKNLKLLHLTSAGMDRVPLDYIYKTGIKLFNAKGIYSIPMSEWVILKILEIYKKSKQFYKNQEQARWEKQPDLLELTGKVATIIGFGDVGIEVAKRLQAFGVYVVGIGRKNRESVLLDEYHTINEIDKVLEKSDIIISSLPLTEETRHLIDEEKIKRMKDGSVFINVSRGEVIDEIALIEAIHNNKFLGVALDVFEDEPLSNESKWWNLENVIITPHISFVSDKIRDRLFELIFKNLNENKIT